MSTANQQNRVEGGVGAWVGDTESFRGVCRSVAELADDATEKAWSLIQLHEDRAGSDRNHGIMTASERSGRWEELTSMKRRELGERLTPTVTVRHRRFDREVTGSLDDVLRETDVADVISAEIAAGSNGIQYELSVVFSRNDGCRFRATGADSNWVASVSGRLERELSARRPWYWRLRIWFCGWGVSLSVLASLLAAWATVAGFRLYSFADALRVATAAIVVVAVSYAGVPLIHRFLPGFELLKEGAQSNGQRVVSVAIAVGAWVMALVIPLLL